MDIRAEVHLRYISESIACCDIHSMLTVDFVYEMIDGLCGVKGLNNTGAIDHATRVASTSSLQLAAILHVDNLAEALSGLQV